MKKREILLIGLALLVTIMSIIAIKQAFTGKAIGEVSSFGYSLISQSTAYRNDSLEGPDADIAMSIYRQYTKDGVSYDLSIFVHDNQNFNSYEDIIKSIRNGILGQGFIHEEREIDSMKVSVFSYKDCSYPTCLSDDELELDDKYYLWQAGNSLFFLKSSSTTEFPLDFISAYSQEIVPLRADINKDGKINALDLNALARSWNTKTGNKEFNPDCDLNFDGSVNVFDLMILAESWNMSI